MAVRGFMLVILGASLAAGGIVLFTDTGPIEIQVESEDPGHSDEAGGSSGGEVVDNTPEQNQIDGDGVEHDVTQSNLDIGKIEWKIHERINEIRTKRGLSRLKMSGRLREIARYHSDDMATSGYFAHDSPSGETMEDRYQKAGYNCRVDVGVGEELSTGAENIAYTYAYKTVDTAEGTVSYDGNETKIAHGIVRQWMNSKPHSENILKDYWEYEGIGVAAINSDGGTKVYATQNFC